VCEGFPTNFEDAWVNVSNYDNQQHLVKSINNTAPCNWERVHKRNRKVTQMTGR